MILKTFFTSKWLALTLIAVLAAVACLAGALWQWDRTQTQLAAEQAALGIRRVDRHEARDGPLEQADRDVRQHAAHAA